MDELESQLDDLVIFELPTFEDVEEFCARFRPRWPGWSLADEDLWLFAVDLRESDDVSQLLRAIQVLVAELDLAAIRFYLDGRAYVLEARTAAAV